MFWKLAIATGLTTTLLVSAANAQLKEFKYSSWTPPPAPNNRFGSIPYFKDVEAELKGTKDAITFKNYMGAQLFNNFTTLKGVRDGAVDAGVTLPIYNAAELKHHTALGELQAPTRDGYSLAAASTESLLLNCAECREDYKRNNTISLGVYSASPFHMMCNFEPKNIADLKGRKSVEGNPTFARFAEKMGMARLQMGPAAYLQALQRGTAECVFGPKDWLNAFSLKDVVKVVIDDVTMGTVPGVSIMTVNLNTWKNKLSEAQRKAFLKHYPATIMRTTHGYYVDGARGEKAAREKGVKFISLGPEFRKAWSDFAARDHLAVIELAKKRGVTNAAEIVDTGLKTLRKWEGIVDRIGRDPQKLTKEIEERIYAKAKF